MDLDDSDSYIFTEVLLPRRSSSSSAHELNDSLQFEVHYRDTTRKTLLTFLFNHSRIMLIMDYLLDTYNFIMCRMFKPSTGLQILGVIVSRLIAANRGNGVLGLRTMQLLLTCTGTSENRRRAGLGLLAKMLISLLLTFYH